MRLFFLFLGYGVLVLGVKSAWQMTGDLLLLAVIYLGFREEAPGRGLILVLLLGYLLDVASSIPLGCAIFSYAATFGVVRMLRSKILFLSPPSRFVWIFVLTLFNGIVLFGWVWLFSPLDQPSFFLLKSLLWNALVTALLGLFVYPFLEMYANWHWETFFSKKDPLLKK